MAYRVEYGSFDSQISPPKKGRGTVILFTVITLALFLSMVNRFWAEGSAVLHKLASPERFLEAGRTLDSLAAHLQNGQPFWETITAFCADVVRQGMEYAA